MFYPVNSFLIEDDIEFITVMYDPLNDEELYGKHFIDNLTDLDSIEEETLSKIVLLNLANYSNLTILKGNALALSIDANSHPRNSEILKNYYLNILDILSTSLFYNGNDLCFNDTTKTHDQTLHDLDLIRDLICELGYYGYYIPEGKSLNGAYTIKQHVNIKLT